MKSSIILKTVVPFLAMAAIACNNGSTDKHEGDTTVAITTPVIKEETVDYAVDTTALKGYIVYNEGDTAKRPAVVLVHEWWGLTDYLKTRAKQFADMGYVAFAADMFGNGKIATDPKEALAFATPFYQNPQLTKTYIDAAVNKLKSYPGVDTANIIAVGYCYGGFVVLNAAKLGAPLKAVVSFHGGLGGVPATKDLLKASILVCNGAADKMVPQKEITTFKKEMAAVGANYVFKDYLGALHAFTNPASTENGKKFNLPIAYNGAADSASWNDMKVFLDSVIKK